MKFLSAPALRLFAMASLLLAIGGFLVFASELGWPTSENVADASSGADPAAPPVRVDFPIGGLMLGFGVWTLLSIMRRRWHTPALWGAGLGVLGLAVGAVAELVRDPHWNTSLVSIAIVGGALALWNPVAAVVRKRIASAEDAEAEAHEDADEHEDQA